VVHVQAADTAVVQVSLVDIVVAIAAAAANNLLVN
jgi:hypothetical protein